MTALDTQAQRVLNAAFERGRFLEESGVAPLHDLDRQCLALFRLAQSPEPEPKPRPPPRSA